VLIPDTFGPFRLTEYGEGFYLMTRARDWTVGELGDLISGL
jgi:hypothetical protein